MTKITLDDLASLVNQASVISTINSNNAAIEAASQTFLYRDGTSPNEMQASLDMNSNRILNLPAPASATDPTRLTDVEDMLDGLEGPQGIQGIQGVQGIQGEQGIQGIQGEQGIQGDQGIQGLPGQDGDIASVETSVTDGEVVVFSGTSGKTIKKAANKTGTGNIVFATSPTLTTPTLTSPTLTTPTLGVATATSINKVTLTAPASTATLTIANNKTLSANNSLALAGVDGTTLSFQATGTVVNRDSTDTLTNKTISGATNTLTVREADLSITDVTTKNVTTAAHGFVPKAPNDVSLFLRGDATWAASPAASFPSTALKGGYPIWSAASSPGVIDGIGPVNAIAYGADPTGAADSTSAIQAAWNAYPLIYLPDGKYKVSSTITGPSVDGAGIIGDGAYYGDHTGSGWAPGRGTVILSTNTTTDVIRSAGFINGPQFRGLSIFRTSQATSGYGLNMNPSGVTCDWAHLADLHLSNHNVGLKLGEVGYAFAREISCDYNRSHGVEVLGQWQMIDVLSSHNGGHGFYSQTSVDKPNGQWRGLASYLNSGYGMYIQGGSSGQGVEAVRISDSFFGADTSGEVYIDSYNSHYGPHMFTNVYCESAQGGGAHGWTISANNKSIHLINCTSVANPGNGVVSFAETLMITGGDYTANGTYGIDIGTGRATVTGVKAMFNGSTGIIVPGATAITITGCYASVVTSGSTNVYTAGNYT